MTQAQRTEKALLSKFIAAKNEPAELIRLREKALHQSNFPNRPPADTESWRKVDLEGLDLESFNLLESKSQLELEPGEATTLEFPEALKDSTHQKLIIEQGSQILSSRPNNTFGALTLALHERGVLILADRATTKPTIVQHRIHGSDALLHRTLIDVKPSAELTVIEEFSGEADRDALWSTLTEAVVGENGRLNYIALGHFTNCEYRFHTFNVDLKRDARVHVSLVNLGGHREKSFYTGRLLGPGAEFRAIGINGAAGMEQADTEMLAEHRSSHTQSSLLYKCVLGGRAHSIFNGNLFIEDGVEHASSHQMSNNILLSKSARSESIPNLIVKTEDVSCEHGATAGELDNNALFYLMSRGVAESEARKLLIEGFINEVVTEIPLSERHEAIMQSVKEQILL